MGAWRSSGKRRGGEGSFGFAQGGFGRCERWRAAGGGAASSEAQVRVRARARARAKMYIAGVKGEPKSSDLIEAIAPLALAPLRGGMDLASARVS